MRWSAISVPAAGRRLSVAAALLLSALVLLSGTHRSGQAFAAATVEEVDAHKAIEYVAAALRQGRDETAAQIARLGPAFVAAVEDVRRLDGSQLHGFSPVTLVESLYRRAEAQNAGEGNRFLAVLHSDLKKRSAALATDTAFASLRTYTSTELKRPFAFAPLSAIADPALWTPLSPAVENAIDKFAEIYTGRHMMRARAMILRNFHKNGFNVRTLEKVLAESRTSIEAMRRMVAIGLPPGEPSEVLRDMLGETMARSAVFASDPSTARVMDELSKELPSDYRRYVQAEDLLESRTTQMAQAAIIGMPGKVERESAAAITAHATGQLPPLGGGGGSTPAPPPTPGPHPNSPTSGGPVPSGGGGGGGAAARHTEAYNTYTRNTFEPLTIGAPTPSNATPRAYSAAIRSARAARGVAVGGDVRSAIQPAPVRATWMPNAKDDRFGRLFMELPAPGGQNVVIAASRVMFADSFHAARSVLWGQHGPEAAFRKGNILVLMSMDPDSEISRGPLLELDNMAKALEERYNRLGPNKSLEKLEILLNLNALEKRSAVLPRGIVVHPAIIGRELSWSTARIDFWFNRINELSAEAASMNGGNQMPQQFKSLLADQADTWQFYELDSTISIGPAEQNVPTLMVTSTHLKKQVGNPRSHFGVSMFKQSETAPPDSERIEPDVYRLPKLESAMQGMLDWLALNHHDFMRLNDFSEALALLRWLDVSGAKITVVALGGPAPAIATPDRVVLSRGPQVPQR